MQHLARVVVCVAVIAGMTGCGDIKTVNTTSPPTTTTTTMAPTTTTTSTTISAADVWRWTAAAEQHERELAAQRARAERPATSPPAPAADPSGRCGGDLPPCSVMRRESGGNPNAYNPRGCGGRGCYGKWQFDPRTWDSAARAAGRPDLVGNYLPSEDDQDAVARHLWAGGRGCSHWAAC